MRIVPSIFSIVILRERVKLYRSKRAMPSAPFAVYKTRYPVMQINTKISRVTITKNKLFFSYIIPYLEQKYPALKTTFFYYLFLLYLKAG